MEEEECRPESEVEPDSDHEDLDSHLGHWLGELESYQTGLDVGETGTVRRRNKTVVTPKMAMESFRVSFLNENEDINFDAILGELCELETQLSTTQSELSNSYGTPCSGGAPLPSQVKDEHRDSGNDLAQAELDALATEITRSLGFRKNKPMSDLDYFHANYPGDIGMCSDAMFDIGETDSAFSDNASLPSSESFTSMVTVSSSADTSSSGDTYSTSSNSTLTPQSQHSDEHVPAFNQCSPSSSSPSDRGTVPGDQSPDHQPPEEQKAILQAEKIRIALEKIKEAKIRKLFVRAFAKDGSSKSILVDEKMTIAMVISILADKNHLQLNPDLAVVEHMPELYMERILEDHDTLVENMVMWTRDTKNKILFESRPLKNDLFKYPEKYLLMSSSSERGASLDPKRRENLIQDFFAGSAAQVPEVEGVLYLKSDGKKAWKKFFFVLRASGLYYNPKGKVSKSLKDLTCLVQFEYVELYNGVGWKKKYHAPTDFCFALKHPQIQKKTSKFIRYLCAENKGSLDQWMMGIRIAKFGKQLLQNFVTLRKEISQWDSRQVHTSISDQNDVEEAVADLNPDSDLHDSLLSMPEPGSRHSIVTVKNSMLVRNNSNEGRTGTSANEVVCLEISQGHERKSSLTGSGQGMSDIQQRPTVKRVSFSNTHSVINADSGPEMVAVRHRDSITSASTDSSEDSTSSGEGRSALPHRSKLRPKLPVTTGTTKQISEMVQMSVDTSSTGSFDDSLDEWRPPVSSPVHKDRDWERRKSAPAVNTNAYGERRPDYAGRDHRAMSQPHTTQPMSPTSPHAQSPQHGRGPRAPMSPQPIKGQIKTHSRGSSISSVDSSDSALGYMFSPTSPQYPCHMTEYDQANWPLYETITPVSPPPVGQGHGQAQGQGQFASQAAPKQGPPTAQKPTGGRKVRSQSAPPEKGHKRNSSKSSLESVEESPTKVLSSSPVTVLSPVPLRAMNVPPPPPPTQPSAVKVNTNLQRGGGQSVGQHSPTGCYPVPAASQAPVPPPYSQAPLSSLAGSVSPRPASHRGSGLSPKPVPPPLVPPAPRLASASAKTHKKRPSGGNIVVNGNQVGQGSPDVMSPRSPAMMSPASGEENNYASLPFLDELNKHMHKPGVGPQTFPESRIPPETLPKPNDQRHLGAAAGISSHNTVHAGEAVTGRGADIELRRNLPPPLPPQGERKSQGEGKKTVPPPPPRRSEHTKLSSESKVVDKTHVPNETSDPIYGNCEGIVDINDLPPPPPELLEGLQEGAKKPSVPPQPGKPKPPPPPPPPKRSKETHLSTLC